MVKCSQDQVRRLKKALQREKDPIVRQRMQMILLREDGKTQPEIAELTGVTGRIWRMTMVASMRCGRSRLGGGGAKI
jgi:hypothetical protein